MITYWSENAKQSKPSNQFPTSSIPPPSNSGSSIDPRATACHMPGSSSPSSSPATCTHSILEPTVINKLLDLLSDLVKRFSREVPAPTPESLSPATKLPTSCSSGPQTNIGSASISLATTTNQLPSSHGQQTSKNLAPNLSVNSLDEFASDLSMETAENPMDTLNFRVLTTQ